MKAKKTRTPEFPEALKAAGFAPIDLEYIPGKSVHPFQVTANAWLDREQDNLMFVDESGRCMFQFMYFIGEERNFNVVGVGRDIAAWHIGEERAERVSKDAADYAAKAGK